jgi:electron transfer flavoprotein alpha subunit
MAEIWVWVETFKGKVANVSFEALSEARRLADRLGGGKVTALVFGEGANEIAATLGARGADRVLACADATLADFRIEPYAAVIVTLAQAQQPDMLLAGTTVRGRDVFAAAAADLVAPLIPDVTALDVVDGKVRATRPVYAGKLLAELESTGKRPLMLTLRSRAWLRWSRWRRRWRRTRLRARCSSGCSRPRAR